MPVGSTGQRTGLALRYTGPMLCSMTVGINVIMKSVRIKVCSVSVYEVCSAFGRSDSSDSTAALRGPILAKGMQRLMDFVENQSVLL